MYGGVEASRNLHAPLLHNLLCSPMSFFDTTPLGRILNRVSKVCTSINHKTTESLFLHYLQDIEMIDSQLPFNIRVLVQCLLMVLSTIIVIMLSTPIFGVVIIPLALIYYYSLVGIYVLYM
jgi:ABC-type multidrug transport system fused ATPase/permease subunit